jgi:hypothetical protein
MLGVIRGETADSRTYIQIFIQEKWGKGKAKGENCSYTFSSSTLQTSSL